MNNNIAVEKVPEGYYENYYNPINQVSKHLMAPLTQKAKGVFYLQGKASQLANLNLLPNNHYAFKAGEVFSADDFNFPVFARPCPVNPRHGFVDSVICKNSEELNIVSKKTLDADPEAEILVTKPIKSTHNIVFNDGVITFGPDNDGATSGKNCQYFYVDNDCIGEKLSLKGTGIIKEGEGPFYEFVIPENDGYPYLVQVRSAPHTPKCKDFVPHQVKVMNIIKAEGDLLEWESKMKGVDKSSTIIDHRGGSLSSHYAIHAVINNIPIFTTYLPEVNSVIEPTAISTEINDIDKDNFFQGFVDGFNSHRDIQKTEVITWARSVVITALGTLHNFAQISAMKDYRLLGQILGLFTKVTFAVSAGESRFAFERGIKNIEYFSEYKKYIGKYSSSIGSGRPAMYKMVTDSSINEVKYIVRNCLNIFGLLAWGGSYGGPRWLSCTTSATKLYNACIKKDIHSVVELFNKVINEMHNGGKYLNKVIDVSMFDQATHNPSLFVISNIKEFVKVISKVNSLEKINNYSEFIEIPTELDKTDFENYKNSIKPKVTVASATANVKESLNPFSKPIKKEKTKQIGDYHIYISNDPANINAKVLLCVEKDDKVVLKTTLDPKTMLKTPVEKISISECDEHCKECNISEKQELVSKEKGYWSLKTGEIILSKIMLNKILKNNNLLFKTNVVPLP